MTTRALDVSRLPTFAFGHRSILWWATMGMILIEGTAFGLLSAVMAIAFMVTRAFEFTALNVWYDDNAYGSIVWFLLGTHTAHVLTDIVDTAFLATILMTGRLDASRFVDVAENASYYYFVVLSWLPIYALLYFAPRFV